MKRFWLLFSAFVSYLVASLVLPIAASFGEEISLPQDQDKQYISVVGDKDDAQYRELLGWFDSHVGLADLKQQARYHAITTDQVVFKVRYKPNIKGLPTIRVQEHDGVVIYEKAGDKLPTTDDDLYWEIVNSTFTSQLPWRHQGSRPLLRRCRPPQEEEEPEPEPVVIIPSQPKPTFPLKEILIFIGAFCVGAVAGIVIEWQQTHAGI